LGRDSIGITRLCHFLAFRAAFNLTRRFLEALVRGRASMKMLLLLRNEQNEILKKTAANV
jgi:hypothetical protein